MTRAMAVRIPTISWSACAGLELAERGDSERALVEASLAGDGEAFAALVRRYEARIFRLLGRFLKHPQDIEEVAQETFLSAWRRLGTFRGEAPFEHWLVRIGLRHAFDRLGRVRPEVEPLAEEVEARSGDPDARLEVERLLTRLPPVDRFVLTLLEGEGWSVAEIAERLGWSRVNVKVRAHRARRRLRRLLEEG